MSNVHFCVLAPNKWLAHLRTANHDNFSVSCCFDDCSHIKPFTTFSGLKCHIYRTHYQEKVSNGGASETDDEEVNFVPYHEENEYVNTSHYQMAEADLTRLLQAQQKQAAALFIMRLREISNQPLMTSLVEAVRCSIALSYVFMLVYISVWQRQDVLKSTLMTFLMNSKIHIPL